MCPFGSWRRCFAAGEALSRKGYGLTPPMPVARTEQSKTPAAAQAMLSLFDAPADQPADKPKEAFVWDESKGIE
jgi:hypothetical protein